jgi:hypothetical protein
MGAAERRTQNIDAKDLKTAPARRRQTKGDDNERETARETLRLPRHFQRLRR